ncbi:MAG: TauD/TfdA family dioxygenase [Wenzhouxiangellaceae bacterium]
MASILDLEPSALTEILAEHPLLIIRGCPLATDTAYTTFARQFGEPLAWEFGEILELKIQTNPSNHIFGQGRVELHWDGAYVDKKPHYNLFQCISGAEPGAGGETLFVDTRRVLEQASAEERIAWRQLVLEYRTEKKAHYGGRIESALICKSRFDNREVIRYIEAFNEDNAEINPVDVSILGASQATSESFLRDFNARLYSSEVMYRHTWQTGDYVIADNSQLLHGRSRFIKPDDQRHIKRINIL